MNENNPLTGLEVFQNVKPATLQTLYKRGTVKEFDAGEQILRARVPADSVCILLSGKAFVYSLTTGGHRKIHFIFGPGVILNDNTVGRTTAGSFCETMEPCRVFAVPVNSFLCCMKEDFSLAAALITSQEKKIWRLEHQQKNMISGIHMERKLAAKLWKLARDFGIPDGKEIIIDLKLPVAFLADMLGVSRETASRLRSGLIRRGLVSMNRKQIVIRDPERMSRFYKTGKI